MKHYSLSSVLFVLLIIAGLSFVLSPSLRADPCGMVPPIYTGEGPPLTRIGVQKTYVFYKGGIETFVIRPGFSGKVDQFGMLIPFPTPPAIRKVSDDIFSHLGAAVDPPEVVIRIPRWGGLQMEKMKVSHSVSVKEEGLSYNQVKVLREEAVGMYEVAVLEAGSADALKRWMDQHGYKYPKGMDKPCNDYVKDGWCFVAVKTRVGQKKGVEPQPGMRDVNSKLPAGANFDGFVQAMGFRFYSDELVVPMRLSAFNKGELRNMVYILTDDPKKITSIRKEAVVRQISGEDLFRNVTEPLPLRIIGGTLKDLSKRELAGLVERRNPVPHNGFARELFAADLLAVLKNRLSHPHEETEKMFLRIGERLGLRGKHIDKLNNDELQKEREKIVAKALSLLKEMTLTVIDDDFPREVLAKENLKFEGYEMPSVANSDANYNVRTQMRVQGKSRLREGVVYRGDTKKIQATIRRNTIFMWIGIVFGFGILIYFAWGIAIKKVSKL